MLAVILDEEALRLPDCERAVLAYRLLASLSRKPAGLDDSWLREADYRMKAFHEGLIEAVAGPDLYSHKRPDRPFSAA